MDVLTDFSSGAFKVAPFDPDAELGWGEWLSRVGSGALALPADLADEEKRAGFGRALAAAQEQARAVDVQTARQKVRDDWFAAASGRVKAAAGVDLPIPSVDALEGGWARRQQDLAAGFGIGAPAPAPQAAGPEDTEAKFFGKVAELAKQYPELADITPDRLDADGRQRLRDAVATSAAVDADQTINPWFKGAAALAGGLAGGLEAGDPATMISLFMPAGGKGASVLARVADAMWKQGLIGAGLTAIGQPNAQAWRGEAGLPSGPGEALANIAMGGAVGALGGGIVQGAGEGAAALGRLLSGAAKPADIAPAAEALRRSGVPLSVDDEAALRGAAIVDDANETLAAAAPPEVPPHAAPPQTADALAAAADPIAPRPLVDLVPPDTTDEAARAALSAARSRSDGVELLAGDPALIASALASPEPALRDLGRIASLDPAIRAGVASLDIPAEHAALVAAMTPDPVTQGALIAALAQDAPANLREARQVASDALDRMHGRSASIAAAGGDPFGPRLEAAPETFAAAVDYGLRLGRAEISGALKHPQLGEISAPIGDASAGLVHILTKHPEVRLADLPAIVSRSVVVQKTARRATLWDGQTEVAVKLTYTDVPSGQEWKKTWLVTAFEPDGRARDRFAGEGGRPGAHPSQAPMFQAGADNPPPPADGNISARPAEINDMVPVDRPDGSATAITRDELAQAEARAKMKSFAISACNLSEG